MTEQEKQQQLDLIEQRAMIAEQSGLKAAAKSWRDLYATVAARPAAEMVLAKRPLPKPPNPIPAHAGMAASVSNAPAPAAEAAPNS